jgi:hypothetical protein
LRKIVSFSNLKLNLTMGKTNMKHNLILFSFTLIISILFLSCAKRIYEVAYPTLNDGKYDSEFPYKSSSAELEKITNSVKKLTAIAYYKNYIFDQSNPATLSDIRTGGYRHKAVREIIYNNSVIGTATIIYLSGRKVALLTCSHVIDFPDTIINYFKEDGKMTSDIQSVAFKDRQNNFVAALPEQGVLETLAVDKTIDIALMGKTFREEAPKFIYPLQYPFGRAKGLEWGSFVYMIGYPKGYRMVTKGLVSQPNRDKSGSFIVDALFNRGFSGGIVLAIRDGIPNFELVGIASSVSADFEHVLVPPESAFTTGYDPRIPYTGDIYIQFNKNINYGITFIISTESIQEFIQQNYEHLLEKGYDLSELLPK